MDDINPNPEPPGGMERRREKKRKAHREFQEAKEKIKKEGTRPSEELEHNNGIYNKYGQLVINTAKDIYYPAWELIADQASSVGGSFFEEIHGEVTDELAASIGMAYLTPELWPGESRTTLARNLTWKEACHVCLYLDLSPLPEYRVADRLKQPSVRSDLQIENSVSQSTLNRMPGRLDPKTRQFIVDQTETLVRHWQGTEYEDWVRKPTPETVSSDGKGVPPIQVLARELRGNTFKSIYLKRDSSTQVSKDAALRALIAAANGNTFVTDAAKNLLFKPWYDGDEIPTGQTLLYHLRKSTREQITRMFTEANKPLFETAADHGYFDGTAEVAIDITDWPFYGDKNANAYVRGTKPTRNYGRAWKYITLSLVGTDTPLVLFVLPVRKTSNSPYYVRRLLRFADQYLDIERAYLDSGFYSSDVARTIEGFGIEFVIQAKKQGADAKNLLHGLVREDLESSRMRYGVGDRPDDADWLVGAESEKKSRLRKSAADNPIDDYTLFYTNAPMEDVEVSELTTGYRNRWGIETGFRVIKEEFLAKSASPDSRIRTFYFNFAAHLYNIWTTANILRADELGNDLSKGKEFTAGRLMQAIEDDQYNLDIPTEVPGSSNLFDGLFL